MSATATPQRTNQKAFESALRSFQSKRVETADATPDIERVREGLGIDEMDAVASALDLSQPDLEDVLDLSVRTLQRRRKQGKGLTPVESDRLWRLLHIWARSRTAFHSDDAARMWLKTPHGLLDGETPLERLDTEPGLREVEDLLTTIDETNAA
ncbi:type II RES/Xre toxin-antitoxin system antitoxin [Longibacter salinarum]|nr:antitoxin Xre-like helix-turn-helix domain-containing protein [Longibacter salinarum]